MQLRGAGLLVALVVLALPAAAQATPGDHILSYEQPILAQDNLTGHVPPTTIILNGTHSWQHVRGSSTIHVRNLYTTDGALSEPTATFRLVWDGAPVAGCTWRIEGGSAGAPVANAAVVLACPLPVFAAPGNHTVAVEVAATGAPITHATTTLTLQQTETVQMNIDVNVTPEIVAHIAWLLWIAYFLMTRFIKNSFMAVLASLVGFGILALPIEETQFLLLAAAQGIALFYDTTRTLAKME